MKTQIFLGLFTAFSSSLCCITPLLALTAGTGSIASTWMEPLRPYLVSVSILVLGFAWFRNLRYRKVDDCGCEQKQTFVQSRTFLSIITVISLLLATFPSYSKFFFDSGPIGDQQQEKTKKIELAVSGMTCTSCEIHIEGAVKKVPGVVSVKASYEKGSTVVEFDESKVSQDKIVATINGTGYAVEGGGSSSMMAGKENCTASSCQIPTGDLPKEVSKELLVLKNVSQIQSAFNKQPGKTRFVAILSSTCKWCLQGAASVQSVIVENMEKKNLSVIIVWTNMLNSDGEAAAFHAASMFDGQNITQFFDKTNVFGDIAAKAINPKGEQAWDIYMYFDKDLMWNNNLPRPFEYVHQLGPSNTWADQTKYFCGTNLTRRLRDVTENL
jgi:mercuric ion transport protein